jgi:hypothetical protein
LPQSVCWMTASSKYGPWGDRSRRGNRHTTVLGDRVLCVTTDCPCHASVAELESEEVSRICPSDQGPTDSMFLKIHRIGRSQLRQIFDDLQERYAG